MIFSRRPILGKWGDPISIGKFAGWSRKLNLYQHQVIKSWWHRFFRKTIHEIDIEIDTIVDGRPYIGPVDLLKSMNETMKGSALVSAFEYLFQYHPQAEMLRVTNLAVRFTDPSDAVMFKLRFVNLTNKTSMQDYITDPEET